MTYNVYKSTNKGHNWTLQGTTADIPPAFVIGGETTSYAYNSVPWPSRPAAVDNPQDGYVDLIVFDNNIEYENTSTFSIGITAPDSDGGVNATATPVMIPSPSNPGTKVVFSSATITEPGSGYIFDPTATLYENGVSSQTDTISLAARTKFISYSLSGTEWDYSVDTALGVDEQKIGNFLAKYSGNYFAYIADIAAVTAGVFTGSTPSNLTSTLDVTGVGYISIPANLSSGIYIVVDNSVYKFAATTWNSIGTMTNTTLSANLYPSYKIESIVETSNGFYAKVTDNPATTTYIFKSTDLLNWSNEQTLGSSSTYNSVTQYLYSFDDNTASFTSTNYLSQIA